MEDSKADLFLVRAAMAAAEIHVALDVVQDGQQAVQFFERAEREGTSCPELVLLDLNLPKKDGIEVLRHMRGSCCKNARVVIMTSSDSVSDREAVRALGYDGYFRKPSKYAEFLKLGQVVKELLEGGGDNSGE